MFHKKLFLTKLRACEVVGQWTSGLRIAQILLCICVAVLKVGGKETV